MPFPDLPPDRIPGSPGHLNDHQLIDQALEYVQQAAYKDDPDFPPLPDVPVLGQSGHVTAHDRILAVLEYIKNHPGRGTAYATIANTPTGSGTDGNQNFLYYVFGKSGSLEVKTDGWAEILVVAGGGGGGSGNGAGGDGGQVKHGLYKVAAQTYAVTIGEGGAGGQAGDGNAGQRGTSSSVGELVMVTGGAGGPGTPGGSAYNGRGYDDVSDITGTEKYYSRGGTGSAKNPAAGGANTGDGGDGGGPFQAAGARGGSGVVIVRVFTD